jgi:hypothetical protein
MVTVWIVVGLLAGLLIAAVYDTRRRRPVLEANLPAGILRAARRKILREQRARGPAATTATHAVVLNEWDKSGTGVGLGLIVAAILIGLVTAIFV